MNRTVVAIELGTADQNNAITVYIKIKGWHIWHWLENVWLLSGLPDEVTPRVLWTEILALPGLASIRGVVFRVEAEPVFWGGNAPDSWEWMKQYWGRGDFPQPPSQPAEGTSP